MNKYKFKLGGVECSACIKLARLDLEKISEISDFTIDEDGAGTIQSENSLTKETINKYLKNNYFIKELDEN